MYPAGVNTRQVSFGPAVVLEDGTALDMQVTIKASRSLVWIATGAPLITNPVNVASADQLEKVYNLPVTDQDGYGDGAGNAISVADGAHSHYYTATVLYLLPGVNGKPGKPVGPSVKIGPFVLPTGDGSVVDIDNLIPAPTGSGTTVAIPDTWSTTLAEAQAIVASKGAAGGLAPLDSEAKLPEANVPDRLSADGLKTAIGAAQLAPSFKIADRTEAAGRALLQPWYGALGMRYTQPANVVVLGDSWTEGHGATALDRRFVARARDSLRKALGITGGVGYIQPDFNSGDSFANPWTFVGTHSSSSTSFGPCRWVQLLNAGSTMQITVHGTSIDVMYGKGGTAQNFTVTVDGGAPTTVTAATGGAFIDGQLARVSLGASGDHTVVITASGTQTVIDGIIVYDGDENAGVRVHACGHYGFTSADWLSPNTNNLKVAVANMTPHLLVIEDMLNDYNSATQAISAATMKANLSTLVTDIRTQIGSRTVPVVFIAAPQPKDNTFTPPNGPWQSYVDALYELADTLPNAVVWDAGQRINSYTSGNRYSMWNDSLHLNDTGQAVLGDALARFLLPA